MLLWLDSIIFGVKYRIDNLRDSWRGYGEFDDTIDGDE